MAAPAFGERRISVFAIASFIPLRNKVELSEDDHHKLMSAYDLSLHSLSQREPTPTRILDATKRLPVGKGGRQDYLVSMLAPHARVGQDVSHHPLYGSLKAVIQTHLAHLLRVGRLGDLKLHSLAFKQQELEEWGFSRCIADQAIVLDLILTRSHTLSQRSFCVSVRSLVGYSALGHYAHLAPVPRGPSEPQLVIMVLHKLFMSIKRRVTVGGDSWLEEMCWILVFRSEGKHCNRSDVVRILLPEHPDVVYNAMVGNINSDDLTDEDSKDGTKGRVLRNVPAWRSLHIQDWQRSLDLEHFRGNNHKSFSPRRAS